MLCTQSITILDIYVIVPAAIHISIVQGRGVCFYIRIKNVNERFHYYRDASKYLVEVLESVNPSELEDVIEKILDAVEKQPRKSRLAMISRKYLICICDVLYNDVLICIATVSSSMIELSVMETAVQDCSQSCDENM